MAQKKAAPPRRTPVAVRAPSSPSAEVSGTDQPTVPEAEVADEKTDEKTGGDGSWASAAEHPCPNCDGEMVQHTGESPKKGAWHCNACGGCWVHRGSAWYSREGHPPPAGWDGD